MITGGLRFVEKLCRCFTTIPFKETALYAFDRNCINKESCLNDIERNVLLRQHVNNVPRIRELLEKLYSSPSDLTLLSSLEEESLKLPNCTHPRLWNYENKPKEILRFVQEKGLPKPIEFSEVCRRLNNLRVEHLGNYTGHKSYYLLGQLAELEQAIIQYALAMLKRHNFNLISVPDILPQFVVKGCGMQIDGERTQVYQLDSKACLSGTSEMSLAGFFAGKTIREEDLPVKVAAVSRCYRAETSGLNEERGIYRVHQFTKVEMFAVCSEIQSESMLDYFRDLQVDLFKNLEINFRLIDMPPSELGAPAYQKYDIEAWMPGRNIWGEISSCSNCTDYQAKRLNIKYVTRNNETKYSHTVNGTAAAVPRLLISIIESNQFGKDFIMLPNVFKSYIRKLKVSKEKSVPETKLIKYIK